MTATPYLNGIACVITGASRGIGHAIAEHFVEHGARVVITGRNEKDLAAATTGLGGPRVARYCVGRANDPDHQEATVAHVLEHFERLDVLVNNVGINPVYGTALELGASAIQKMVDVNVIAPLGWTRAAYRQWMARNGGTVINMSSINAGHPTPGLGMYGATKSMLDALTRQLAVELAPAVRVNGIAPGIVTTSFSAALYADDEAAVAAGYPLRRLGRPHDVAALAGFLASPAASWITGETVVVDGGATAGFSFSGAKDM
ncbi:SDR family oxidoreductase [Mycolicibacterium sp.]|uniref:SDR family oxidoreductase n=1 Tax=Mycolicibacterium sp. TaxID=2320850 RepID=UPI0037CAC287